MSEKISKAKQKRLEKQQAQSGSEQPSQAAQQPIQSNQSEQSALSGPALKASVQINKLCLRCPDELSAGKCSSHADEPYTASECISTEDVNQLWWGFSNKDNAGMMDVLQQDPNSCEMLLKEVFEQSKNITAEAARFIDGKYKKPQHFDAIYKLKGNFRVGDVFVTKQMLEFAFQSVVIQGGRHIGPEPPVRQSPKAVKTGSKGSIPPSSATVSDGKTLNETQPAAKISDELSSDSLCLRCMAFPADHDCIEYVDTCNSVWPGFSDQATPQASSNYDECFGLLKDMRAQNSDWLAQASSDARKHVENASVPAEQYGSTVRNLVDARKAQAMHKGQLVTRAQLENAYQTVYRPSANDVTQTGSVVAGHDLTSQMSNMTVTQSDIPSESAAGTIDPVTSVFEVSAPVLELPKSQKLDQKSIPANASADLYDGRANFPSASLGADVNKLVVERRFATRKSFAQQQPFQVFTNHFKVSLEKGVEKGLRLHQYIVTCDNKEWKDASRNKRKVLIRALIDRCPEFRDNLEVIASDYHTKIIAARELLGDKAYRDIKVPSYRPGVKGEPVEVDLRVSLQNSFSLDGLQKFVSGQMIDYADSGAIEALNIMIAKAVSDGSSDTFQAGNNKFFFRPGWEELGPGRGRHRSGLIAVRGYSCSVRPAMGAATLNVNTLTSAFYRPALVQEYLKQFRGPAGFPPVGGGNRQQDRNLQDADQFLRGLRVFVNFERKYAYPESVDIDGHRRRIKTIHNVANRASEVQFERSQTSSGNSNFISVEKHIKDTYASTVQDLDFNGDQLAINVGGKAPHQKYYMSSHLRVIGDQIYKRKVLSDVVDGMIEVARRTPQQNRYAILTEGITSLGLHSKSPPAILQTLGIEISPQMMSVPARRVITPQVQYRDGKMTPHTGNWMTKNQKFVSVGRKFDPRINNPGVRFICVDEETQNSGFRGDFVKEFMKIHHAYGLQRLTLQRSKVGNDQRDILRVASGGEHWSPESLKRLITPWTTGAQPTRLVVLMLPSKDSINAVRHANFKIACEQILGVQSTVLCEDTMEKSCRHPSSRNQRIETVPAMWAYFGNIAMKLCMRLGNVSHRLAVPSLPVIYKPGTPDCMILGADVTHPGAGSNRYAPSIAAVIGSTDGTFGLFPGSMRVQARRQEEITDMKDMTMDCLDRFYTVNSALPTRILFYRDGVSDGYLERIQKTEIQRIKDAWKSAWLRKFGKTPKESDLKITAVTVQKRHHTRFYPMGAADTAQATKNGNCQPGTLVDSSITSPYFFDFFLQSHKPLQGTAKPTHYFVMQNEMGFREEQLQDLTNNLCYANARSTNAMSYVAPAYYADRLCERGRQYLRRFYEGSPDLRDDDEATIMQKVYRDFYRNKGGVAQSGNPWHQNMDNTMFWL